ncbi:hypothetical protein PC129_g19083 [Phytophthora cactorum]|uniref:Uncharacterized protein n=1 Tax=Phytophthora cactorum TaxID=29920 RepID=A0A8T1HEB0_9STRA|nr:hypothetical protein PC129_g19083 [Phytophthora cactorum]
MPERHLICPPSDASPQRLRNFCVEPRSPFKPCRPQASHDRLVAVPAILLLCIDIAGVGPKTGSKALRVLF